MNYDNCKIQIMYEKHLDDQYRWFWWRIKQSELSLWDRIFHKNPWRQFQKATTLCLSPYYSPKDYKEQLENIITYKDAVKYQKEQNIKVNNERENNIKKGREWGF